MSTQNRTEAHKEFAKLYRIPREPEHQKKVDEIISRTNDVFIRIDLITKLDQEYNSSPKKSKEDPTDSPSNSGRQKPISKEPPHRENSHKTEPPKTENKPAKEKPKKEEPSSGLITSFFQTVASISDFAKQTGAIEISLLTRKPSIAESVKKLFRTLKEVQIISTITAFKYAEEFGWKTWNPGVYNTVTNFGKFFQAFVALDTLFRDDVAVDIFLAKSQKMQMYYLRHLNKEHSKEIVFNNIVSLVRQNKKIAPREQDIISALDFTLNFESKKPTLTDAICAFYIVDKKKLYSWSDIEAKLKVLPIKEDQYSTPPNITKQIAITSARIKNEIEALYTQIEHSEKVKKTYFNVQPDGKIVFDFINKIIKDYIFVSYTEQMRTQEVFNSIKNSPHILLQVIYRDIHNTYLDLLSPYLKVEGHGGEEPKEIKIISNELFANDLEKIYNFMRTLDTFNRQYSSFQYTFQFFSRDVAKGPQDPVEAQVLKLLLDSASFFGNLAKKFTIIIHNHEAALALGEKEELNEKLIESKTKEIEDLKVHARFIPHSENKLVTRNRLNGYTIVNAIIEFTKHLYNYALLFKDKNIISDLTVDQKLASKIDILNKDYKRLTGKDYINQKQSDTPVATE